MVMTIQAFHHSVPNTTEKDLFSHGMTMVQTRSKTLKLACLKTTSARTWVCWTWLPDATETGL